MRPDLLERRLGHVLNVGSLASMFLFAAGLTALFAGWRRLSEMLVHAGLLMLFTTPFVRVSVTIVAYWHARDWTFVAMTSTVLLVLLGSVLVSML